MNLWMRLSLDDQEALFRIMQAAEQDPGRKADVALLRGLLIQYGLHHQDDAAYRDAVEVSDELEVEPDGLVSISEDDGAWVMAWVWVTDKEVGVSRSEDEP